LAQSDAESSDDDEPLKDFLWKRLFVPGRYAYLFFRPIIRFPSDIKSSSRRHNYRDVVCTPEFIAFPVRTDAHGNDVVELCRRRTKNLHNDNMYFAVQPDSSDLAEVNKESASHFTVVNGGKRDPIEGFKQFSLQTDTGMIVCDKGYEKGLSVTRGTDDETHQVLYVRRHEDICIHIQFWEFQRRLVLEFDVGGSFLREPYIPNIYNKCPCHTCSKGVPEYFLWEKLLPRG